MTNQVETKPVLLVRASGNEADAAALANLGLTSVIDPYLSITALPGAEGYAAATALLENLTKLGKGDWVIATSANGLKFWATLYGSGNLSTALAAAAERGVRFAGIGEASAAMYAEFGIHEVFVPGSPYGENLAAELISAAAAGNHRALVPAGNLAMPTLTNGLAKAGWEVTSVVVYETASVAELPPTANALARGEFSAVLLRSPSAARALVQFAGATSVPVICGGTTTATTAAELGLRVVAISSGTSPAQLAQTIFDVVNSPLGAA